MIKKLSFTYSSIYLSIHHPPTYPHIQIFIHPYIYIFIVQQLHQELLTKVP